MLLNRLIKNKRKGKYENISPYIIAEAGVNHEGSIDTAKRLIDEAKLGGANAIKFQSYKADTIAIKNSPAYWDLSYEKTKTQHQLFSKHDKFWKNEFEILAKYCQDSEIDFMSTPFDLESASFLNDLMDIYKISSSDINNKPFIEAICKYNKPIILSTGAAYMWEIEEAVSWIDQTSCPLALLHCVLNYPTKNHNANLKRITQLINKFPDNLIGYSDHTMPGNMEILEISALMGASIIEKHFTHNKNLPGNDHYHSMDFKDIQILRKRLNVLNELLGNNEEDLINIQLESRINARRSLVANRHIKKGHKIKSEDITWKRPGNGINPKYYQSIIGSYAIKDIEKDTTMKWDMIQSN